VNYVKKCNEINNHYEIHLQALDLMLVQLSKMKMILIQHYQFLFYTFSDLFVNDWVERETEMIEKEENKV
jgi:hypothetical protein